MKEPQSRQVSRLRQLAMVMFVAFCCVSAAHAGPVCTTTATTLCLSTTFEVEVSFTDGHGTADAMAVPLGTDKDGLRGGFTFRDPRYGEVIVQVLNACAVNANYWFFGASLTDFAYTINVTDLATNTMRSYPAAAGARASFATVSDFPCTSSRSAGSDATTVTSPTSVVAGSAPEPSAGLEPPQHRGFFCSPDADTACLYGTRFPIDVDGEYPSSPGTLTALAHDPNFMERTAVFGYAGVPNMDVAVKIVETCGSYEVHWANIGDSMLDIEIFDFTDLATWNSPAAVVGNGVDRSAFENVPGCLFSGDFELGTPFDWSSSSP